MPVRSERLYGQRIFWPIYEALVRNDLVMGLHWGGTSEDGPSPTGWPAWYVEEYAAEIQVFATQLTSLVMEGVFQKFPKLTLVLIESGFTWLPPLLWRTGKLWRGVRPEVPWIDRAPADIIRERVRLTLQPVDAPSDAKLLMRTLEQIGSDRMLLFSTDYPHWQFDGDEALPDGLPDETVRKVLIDNPLETYPRLREGAVVSDNAARQVRVSFGGSLRLRARIAC